ncbi:MAG: DUF3997 domain-containing protein [Clostridia bacterium]|nr:DUF3997 domain-containing protein [Clostridia bacterium]
MKKFPVVGLLLFMSLWLSACTFFSLDSQIGNNDWSYKLPNDYEIWHVNSRKIVCGKKASEHSLSNVGGDYVVEFCHNDQYICLKCADASEDFSKNIDETSYQFYIINTINDEVDGPLSEGEYFEKLENMSLNNLSA